MSTQYQKRGLNVNGNIVPTVLRGRQGSPQLVAIYNLVTMKYASKGDSSGSFSEKALKSILNDFLDISIESMDDISPDQAKEVKYVLANIRTEFSLQPRLSGHVDFVNNPSFMLCRLLNLIVLHGWVLDPEVSIYDTLKDLSHSELVDYSHGPKCKSDHQIVCQGLLNDSSIQLTSYGFNSLSAELEDDGAALLCHKRLDIIHKYKGVLFILVTDKDIYEQMPQAVWRLFEERQESNIYFTESFTPVREQQHRAKAMDWYRKFLETQRKDVKLKEEKGKEKTESSQQREADWKVKKLPQQEQSQSCQQVLSDDAATKSSEPSEAARKLGEDKSSDKMSSDDDKRAVAVGSHHSERSSPHEPEREEDGKVKKLPQQEQSAAESSESSATTRKEGEDKLDKATPDDHKRAEAVGSHHSNISVGQVGLPEGVASDFLNFLNEFKDNGCSAYYFQGIVAAFTSHSPLFYVPYDFIMAHNELLALKVQDSYSGIYGDLKKAVDFYLSTNKVDSLDAVVKIIGLPAPKSVQRFVDFVDTIILHEHYVVYGGRSEALPSYDSRRMGLGYLGCIVAKFRTGRCWGGKWSEDNMKVKDKGSKFVIELKEDYELTPELGYLDLRKFCETVLDRLKFDGQFLPYFDELADDHMLITDCFGKPEKWQRFLELISYPLALKPPLVRASFICNVYIAGDANSSGDPPTYSPLSSRKDCVDWRHQANGNELLRKVYEHQNARKIKKYKYLIDIWSVKHWHVFKFSRHFTQHALEYTKGEDLIQRVKNISILDILLFRTIGKAIAASVRFLVLNCGVEGLFSNVWRHYSRSDYIDKPNVEDGGIVQGLLDSICEQKEKTGRVYLEISTYLEPQHVSVIITDADLMNLNKHLNANNFQCALDDKDRLHCGSITLWKRFYPSTKESAERGVIVMEGPYSAEYDTVYVLLTQFLGLSPTL